jgi:GntR family transcriptional regulator, transcriptional repressor for pyruvate dehydrogenase complex
MAGVLNDLGRGDGFRPSPVVPLSEQIRRQLVEAVTRGDLRPGDRLPGETTLAAQFGVSTAEARAGLSSLVDMGLIEIVRGRHGGVRIAQPKPDQLQRTLHDGLSVLVDLSGVTLGDLAEARRETETACARAAARRRTEDDLRAMRTALDRSADEQLEISEWLGLDIVFHRGVADASHNAILAMPLTAVHAVAQPRLNKLIAEQLDRATVHAQHTAIYQAIAGRKPQAAARAVQDHVAYLEVRYARLAPASRLIS